MTKYLAGVLSVIAPCLNEEVNIGPHCRIGVVEARELTVHESSEVKERRPMTRGAIDNHAGYAESGAPLVSS